MRPSALELINRASEFGYVIRPLSPHFGAEVLHVSDLGAQLPEAKFQFLKHAFEEFSVLVIRNQQELTVADHIAFSARFGPLEHHVLSEFTLPNHPEIYVISNEQNKDGSFKGLTGEGQYWHSDLSYMVKPSLGSFLHAQKLPEFGEGDTIFISMLEVYDHLPEQTKERIAPLWAEHNYELMTRKRRGDAFSFSQEQREKVPPVLHPVVRAHEGNGRKSLFVNPGFTSKIVGVEDADLLLNDLFDAAVSGIPINHVKEESHSKSHHEFVYRHKWLEGDLVMWDNRAVLHHATKPKPGQARTLHRTTIQGPTPTPAFQSQLSAVS